MSMRVKNSLATTLRMSSFDTNGNPVESRSADTTYRICIILSSLLFIFYLLELIFLIIISTSSSASNVEQAFSWSISPVYSRALVIAAIAFGLILNPISLCGILGMNREIVGGAFWSSFLVVFVNVVVFIYLQMRGNGLIVVPAQGEATLETFSIVTEEEIVRFAMDEQESWLELQKTFGDCCGLNFKTTYGDDLFKDINNFDLDLLLSNDQCIVGRDRIDAIQQQFPEFNKDAADAAEADDILSSDNFFCEPFMADSTKSRAQNISSVFGVQVFLQITLMFFLGQMIYTYQEKEGGLKPNEDDLTVRAKVENTILVKAGYQPRALSQAASASRPGSGYEGNTMGSKQIRF